MPTLYDHLGRPVELSALRREHAAPSLAGVRTVWHGEAVAQGLTPDRLARILRNAADGDLDEYLILAEEMEEREPHYASVLGTRKRAISALSVVVEAATDDKRDVEMADAVRALAQAPAFGDLVDDLLDGLGKGYAACEIMWDTRGRRWEPADYVWRDPRFFVFDREQGRELRLLDQADAFLGLPLPPFKFVVHIPKLKSGLPARGGLARLAAVPFMCKSYTLADWMRFAEVFGMPLRVGRHGASASAGDIATLIRAVANIGTDAACVIPDTMRIEFVEGGKSAGGHELFERLAEWGDRQVSKAVLGQTMTTDNGSSLAQAQVHNEVRQDIRDADARQLGNTICRDLVRPYVDLNFGPPASGLYPTLKFFIPEPEDIAALVNAVKDLAPLGLEVEQSVMRDKLNLPDPEPGAKLLQAPGAQPPADEPAANRAKALNRAGVSDPDADLAELEAEALADWERLMAPVLDPVQALADSSATYEEFLAGLPGLLAGGMDSAELARRLAGAAFKARGLGDGGA